MKQIRNRSPRFLKLAYRYVKYRNQRLKHHREKAIKAEQNRLLTEFYDAEAKELIVFLVPGADWETGSDKISGGVISIVSICEQTKSLKTSLNAEVVLCTLRDDHLFLKHTMFENNTDVLRFDQLPSYFSNTKNILIHVPEFLTSSFLVSLITDDKRWLKSADVQLNILNQNISLMPAPNEIQQLKHRFGKVTITTAHQKYCTAVFRKLYDVPIHKLSVWISPEQYHFKNFTEKENLIVVSPDKHERRDEILKRLNAIPNLQVKVIQNLTYENYKLLISKAKWSITFGEGLDGYFIEPVFSGAISFAVYNTEFFTPDFGELNTVYPTYDELAENLENDINAYNNIDRFSRYQQQQFALCAKYYSKEVYEANIRKFYEGDYTFK